MAKQTKVYWDACAWLGLINGEAKKARELQIVWKMAERGEVQIWTSALALAEVYRAKCEKEWASLDPTNDAKIDNMFDQPFVEKIQLDTEVARMAKNLLRTFEKLKKPTDAIHLASALKWNVDQLHTYDGSDLLGLSGQAICENGEPLIICMPDHLTDGELFAGVKDITERDNG